MAKRDLRRHQRVEYLGPARISWEDAKGIVKYAQARCLEVSKSGLRIAVEVFEPVAVHSRVSLRVDGINFHGSGTTKHVLRRGARFILGLELGHPLDGQVMATINSPR
jgi:hypothetical protein